MIKRRFYRFEHASREAPSGSSSSSDSEIEAEPTDETEVEEDDDEVENGVSVLREKGEVSSSSGYESEDSSANEVNLDSSGLPSSDDDVATQNGEKNINGSFPSDTLLGKAQRSPEKDVKIEFDDVTDCVFLKCKSVFKCRLCPRIVCLSEETLKAHLNSKRHARSEKLYKEGRLKLMLNIHGEIEGETAAENDAATTDSLQKSAKPKKKGKGKLKERKRSKKEMRAGKGRQSREKRPKRRKSDS